VVIAMNDMNKKKVFDQIKDAKSNPKIAKALDIFERTQEIYEKSMHVITPYKIKMKMGTYSSSISTENYHANSSTIDQSVKGM
jgi:hypothetical protein